jgi:hypothetical protein
MGDLRGDEPPTAQGEKAVPLAQPMFERACVGCTRRPDGLVVRDERGVPVHARVVDPRAVPGHDHARQPVAEPVEAAADARK